MVASPYGLGPPRSPPISSWPTLSGSTRSRSRRCDLLDRVAAPEARANPHVPRRWGWCAWASLRPMTPAPSTRARVCTNTAAAPSPFRIGPSISRTSPISDSIARLPDITASNNASSDRRRKRREPPPREEARGDALRYADGVIDPRRGRIVCVREDHTRPGEAINTLVSVDISGAGRRRSSSRGMTSIRRRGSIQRAAAWPG